MAETVVFYLSAKQHKITIASNILKDAEEIAKKFQNCSALSVDVGNQVSYHFFFFSPLFNNAPWPIFMFFT